MVEEVVEEVEEVGEFYVRGEEPKEMTTSNFSFGPFPKWWEIKPLRDFTGNGRPRAQ